MATAPTARWGRPGTQVSSKPVTVKMRTGVVNDRLVAHKLLPTLRDLGIVAATVRPRERDAPHPLLLHLARRAHAGSSAITSR